MRHSDKRYTCHFCGKGTNKAYKCGKCGEISCKDCATMGNSAPRKLFRRTLAVSSLGVSDFIMSKCPNSNCGGRSMKSV